MPIPKFDSKSFNAQAFGKYTEIIPKERLNELIGSGAIQPNTAVSEPFSNQTGVFYANIPMYGRIGGAPLNFDGNTNITATSTATYDRGVVVIGRAKAWVERDFSEDITGGAGFMSNVARQVVEYWGDVDQDTVLAILKGIFSMTGVGNLTFVNNHTSDISAVGTGLVGASTLNSAIQKASGDKKGKFVLSIMHSTVATNLENMQLLSYMTYTDANGIERQLSLASWNGKTVIIDDGMPTEEVEATGSGETLVEGYTKYTTYVLGNGAFDYADIGAEVPYAMTRDESTNGGQTTLYSRQRKVFAPYGISFTKVSVSSNSPTDEELEMGLNWSLVNDGGPVKTMKYFDHKAIAIARIISKG